MLCMLAVIMCGGLLTEIVWSKPTRTNKPHLTRKQRKAKFRKPPARKLNISSNVDLPELPDIFLLQVGFKPTQDILKIVDKPDTKNISAASAIYTQASWFGILKQPQFREIKNCETDYAVNLFKAAVSPEAQRLGLTWQKVQALHAKESFCRNVTSHTGPTGWSQFTKKTGLAYGLAPLDRLIPEKAVPAAVRLLVDLYKQFGDWGLAFWGYHSGAGVPAKAVSIARVENLPVQITMDSLLFVPSPDRYPSTYKFMRNAYRTDYSTTYYNGILAMEQILEARRNNPEWIDGLWMEYQATLNQPENGAEIKYNSRYQAFVDMRGGYLQNLTNIHLVRQTNQPVIVNNQKSQLPSEDILGLYYYLNYKIQQVEKDRLGRSNGNLALSAWTNADFSIDLGVHSTRRVWIVELLRRLAILDTVGYEESKNTMRVTLNPKMKIWGLANYLDNHPIFNQD